MIDLVLIVVAYALGVVGCMVYCHGRCLHKCDQ